MKKNNKGFTLTEVLAVVVIIGILTSVALPQYRRAIKKSRATQAVHMLRVIYDSSERLAAELGYKDMTYIPTNTLQFSRLDMFDSSSIKCGISGDTMTCTDFKYTVSPSEINAFPSSGEGYNFTLYPPFQTNGASPVRVVCRSYNDEDLCEPYGLEWENSWVGKPAPDLGDWGEEVGWED